MTTDILIIGGGLTGIAAAYEIIKNSDLQVTLLQCGGGASPYIHGFCLPVGDGDSEELFYHDSMASGYQQSRPSLVKRLCHESLTLQEYFAELNLAVDENERGYQLIKSLGSTVARIAGIHNNTGPAMLSTLRKQLNASDRYREYRNFRALELVKQDGRVTGAYCYDKDTDSFCTVGAKLVILATGGFGKLFPESTNSADIGGDGCAMAYLAGAKMTDMEFIQFEPSAAVWPSELVGKSIITTMFYEGAVLRGKDGERFMLRYSEDGERVSKDLQAKCICDEIRRNGATEHGGVWFDATAVPQELWEGVYKPYRNRYLNHGIDMCKVPVEIAPAAHTTCGGALIDENCRTGIPGLLACGEVTGGLHGANRLGGNAGLETMVFGRIAGQTAVRDFDSAATPAVPDQMPNKAADVDIAALRSRLQNLLRGHLGVIRNEQELLEGLQKTDELLAQLGDHRGCFVKHRLYNDLLTARIALVSALQRKQSIGCHYREDSQTEDIPYRIIVEHQDGSMILSKESV
ncbi:MAG: FAD-dependent oxidoreductase [Ruminococcaceae bacterium]|nr:FAD-dependent oxidoreductase [Oscillospiraceae bacterium]